MVGKKSNEFGREAQAGACHIRKLLRVGRENGEQCRIGKQRGEGQGQFTAVQRHLAATAALKLSAF